MGWGKKEEAGTPSAAVRTAFWAAVVNFAAALAERLAWVSVSTSNAVPVIAAELWAVI